MKEIEFLENKIFEGIVTHERLKPFSHKFKYYASYFWFDIRKFKNTLLFKKNKFSLFSFYENDHGDPDVKYLKLYDSIIKKLNVFENLKIHFIKVLCLPRILGYSFNPISLYVCYDKNKNPKVVIFQVNNTFNERHSYYCNVGARNYFYFEKKLYVSPFFKVNGFYKIKLKLTKNRLLLNIDYEVKKTKVFSARFIGKAVRMNSRNLITFFFKNIFQNVKITFGIYFQALKLLLKGAKYIKKPLKPNNNFTPIK